MILSRNLALNITLKLTTMRGQPHLIKFNGDFDGFDLSLPPVSKPGSLRALVKLILKRRSASENYVAERNGVRVIQYQERLSFRQAMGQIGFQS